MDEKRFTIEEAEKALPWLSKTLKKALKHKAAIEEVVDKREEFSRMIEVTGDEGFQFVVNTNVKASMLFHAHCLEFYDLIHQVLEKGMILKDLDQGLIDFPFALKNKDALLCWKLGEKGILYWHDKNAGYQGRQLIVNLR